MCASCYVLARRHVCAFGARCGARAFNSLPIAALLMSRRNCSNYAPICMHVLRATFGRAAHPNRSRTRSRHHAGHCRGVVWASEGRSTDTRARADACKLTDVGTVAAMLEQCDIVLSVCPPGWYFSNTSPCSSNALMMSAYL